MNPEAEQHDDPEITINLMRNTGYRQIKYGVSNPGSFAAGASSEDRTDLIDCLSRCIPQDFKGEIVVKSESCRDMRKYDELLNDDEVKEIRQQLQKTRTDISIALTDQELIDKIKGIFADIEAKNTLRKSSYRNTA